MENKVAIAVWPVEQISGQGRSSDLGDALVRTDCRNLVLIETTRLDRLSMDIDHIVTSSEAQFTDGIGQLNQLFPQTRSLVQKIGRLTDDVQQ